MASKMLSAAAMKYVTALCAGHSQIPGTFPGGKSGLVNFTRKDVIMYHACISNRKDAMGVQE